jgi:hypothetical protein
MHHALRTIAIVAIATAAHFTYLYCSNADFFYPDSFTYLAPAKMLLAGHGFAMKPGLPETQRTPGYPLLLAAFGTRVLPVIVLQHLLDIALCVAVYFFVLRYGRFAAITAALLVAIDPPTIHYANKVLTETVFTALLFVAFWLAGQARAPVLHGLLTGALVLIRPVAIAWFVVIAILYAMRRVPWRTIAIFVVAALALPLAWAARNRIVAGNFTVSTIGANNLLLHRAAGAMAIADEGDFDQDLVTEQRDLLEEAHDLIQQKEHVAAAEDLPEAKRAPYYAALARRVILQHPIAFAVLTLRGIIVNVLDSDWDAIMMISRLDGRAIELAVDAFVAVVFALAVAGVIALWSRDRALAMLIAGTVVYFLLISAGGEAEARFRVPVVPQIAIAAACGLDALRRPAPP